MTEIGQYLEPLTLKHCPILLLYFTLFTTSSMVSYFGYFKLNILEIFGQNFRLELDFGLDRICETSKLKPLARVDCLTDGKHD